MRSALFFPILCFAGSPLDVGHLEAIHAQRVEWMKTRVTRPSEGVYTDFRGVVVSSADAVKTAKQAEAKVLFVDGTAKPEIRSGILIAPPPSAVPSLGDPERVDLKNTKELQTRFKQFPDEVFALAGTVVAHAHDPVALRQSSVHVLARDLNDVPQNLNRNYAAHDWLCDPVGFSFIAENNFGAYEIGDTVPIMKGTKLIVNLPVPGTIRLLRDNAVATAQMLAKLEYPVVEEGSYRVEVSLSIDGTQWPWIATNPIEVRKPNFTMPMIAPSPKVDVRKGVAYIDDGNDKHRLDLYLPKDRKSFPVMVFYHGGSWKSGDRSLYPMLGDRFAKAGVGVAIPSYRLMPKDPHPAQIEDAAAAFNWVYKNIAQLGGDVSKIYIVGHSAGGHLVSLLALDPQWLKKYDISPGVIHGVASLSGVYDVEAIKEFKGSNASPVRFVHPRTPPFLISYCQWDYLGLPRQAREFSAALKKEFDDVRVLYVPGESHITEVISALKDDDPTARALLEFVR
jgi:acetyl esterase/lipase